QPDDQDETAPPACPNCGAPMVLREVTREGPRKGEQFWGCPNFPRCRGTRDLEDTG
ncbi:MAG: topoisomerase DNA-binding C4 zinc finger domain-containing protein, partial [Chloroflexota bacterium]